MKGKTSHLLKRRVIGDVVQHTIDAFVAKIERIPDENMKANAFKEWLTFAQFRQVWNELDMNRKINLFCTETQDYCQYMQIMFLVAVQNIEPDIERQEWDVYHLQYRTTQHKQTTTPKGQNGRNRVSAARKRPYDKNRFMGADKARLKRIARQVAGVYALYTIYEVQPFSPKVKIYLPLPCAQELQTLLCACNKVGTRDVHAIVSSLSRDNGFVYGALKAEFGPRVYTTIQKRASMNGKEDGEVNSAKDFAMTGLSQVLDGFDSNLWDRYNKGLMKILQRDSLDFDFMLSMKNTDDRLSKEIQRALGKRVQTQYVDKLFGRPHTSKSGPMLPTSTNSAQAVQKITDKDQGEVDWNEFLKGLPPSWKKKIKLVLARQREREKEKQKEESSSKPSSVHKSKAKKAKAVRKAAEVPLADGASPEKRKKGAVGSRKSLGFSSEQSNSEDINSKNKSFEEDEDYDENSNDHDAFCKLLEDELANPS